MPIYEYECKKCGEIIEEFQSFSDKPLKKHKECGGKLERLISLSAFHLKGSGWYDTEYGKKKVKRGTQSAEKGDKAEGDTKTESTSSDTASSSSDSSTDSSSSSTESSSATADSINKETSGAKNKSK